MGADLFRIGEHDDGGVCGEAGCGVAFREVRSEVATIEASDVARIASAESFVWWA